MKRRTSILPTFIGSLLFFLLVAAIVTVAVIIYGAVASASNGNTAFIAGIMLIVVIALSLICTLADFLRRKYTVEKTVDEILEATDKIAAGDFSVRLKTAHSYRRYDQYDYIIENLNTMTEALSRTEILNNDFIAGVSHELKTPLAVIQNYASSLQNKNLDEATRVKYAQTLVAASKKLTTLVTNILKLNKLENQQIASDYERVDLVAMLSEAIVGFEDFIEEKGIELECDFDEDVKIISSPSNLEIVWNNLISNAIKFTEAGGKITVRLKRSEDFAVVSVEDTGCGISEETGKHIFEKFYQGDTSHATEGNGLGLALVKKVIDIIGGEISVESELGKGTTFTVKLKSKVA